MVRSGVMLSFLVMIAVQQATAMNWNFGPYTEQQTFYTPTFTIGKILARHRVMNAAATRQHEDICPEGGMNLVATSAVQTFSLLQYANFMDCNWEITTQDTDMVVYINIGNYAIEHEYSCGYDYLAVNEGDGCDHMLCGTGSFQGHSIANTMSLHFHSDFSIVHNGFTVEYSQVPATQAPPHAILDSMVDGSVIALNADMSEYVLASHPCAGGSSYQNDIDYTTTVTVPEGMAALLTVQQFHLEGGSNCPYDWVSIYNNAGALIHTWCSTDGNGQQAVSLDNLTIHWHTDYSVTASGFIFDLSIADASTVPPYQTPDNGASACPGPLSQELALSEELVIASPNYGCAQYDNDMACSWIVSTQPGQVLSITILAMSIESHATCVWDALTFFDGATNEIETLCGTTVPPTFYTSGSELLIAFTTDSSVTRDGFMLEITAVTATDVPVVTDAPDVTDAPVAGSTAAPAIPVGAEDPCNSGPVTITETGTTIANPVNSLGVYENNALCSWLVYSTDISQTVTFTFNSFELEYHAECSYDDLSLYNSNMADSNNRIGMYCGSSSPASVTSRENIMFIQFKSDYSVQYAGFSGTVSFGHETPTEPSATPGVSSGGDVLPDITNDLLSDYTCGAPAISHNVAFDRIVGGTEAVSGSWPWQISLRRCSNCHGTSSEGYHTCGGVILSERWVISAAHCISNGVQYKIVAGDHNRDHAESTEQVREVQQIIVNSHYATDGDRDAALLYLSTPLTFNDRVKPICLSTDVPAVGTNCVATGWGTTHGTGSNTVLRQVPLPILSDSYCADRYGSSITPYTVCAGYEEGGRDTCQGDSGGPLVCEIDGSWQLHGLTSFGRGCAEAGWPGVYARVTPIMDWIQAYTNNAVYMTGSGRGLGPISPRPDHAERIINWSRRDGKAQRQGMTEAHWKLQLAELTQKGADNSEKLLHFLRSQSDMTEQERFWHLLWYIG